MRANRDAAARSRWASVPCVLRRLARRDLQRRAARRRRIPRGVARAVAPPSCCTRRPTRTRSFGRCGRELGASLRRIHQLPDGGLRGGDGGCARRFSCRSRDPGGSTHSTAGAAREAIGSRWTRRCSVGGRRTSTSARCAFSRGDGDRRSASPTRAFASWRGSGSRRGVERLDRAADARRVTAPLTLTRKYAERGFAVQRCASVTAAGAPSVRDFLETYRARRWRRRSSRPLRDGHGPDRPAQGRHCTATPARRSSTAARRARPSPTTAGARCSSRPARRVPRRSAHWA